jgi:thioesterase domain-containing protein/aryl carrier-like protein
VRVSPVTSTQRVVAGVWHELLGVPVDGFDVHDNFFALGGNSLQAIQLITRVRDALQTTLNLRDIYAAPSIAGIADAVDERGTGQVSTGGGPEPTGADGGPAQSVLVPLRPAGGLPPLFCVHAIGGSAAPFVPLAALLGADRPVYGLEAPGLHGGEPLDRVEDLAERYLVEIRRVRRHGPYHLVAWSAGGFIVLEIARLLAERHGESAAVILLDSVPPPPDHMPEHAELLLNFAADLAAQAGVDGIPVEPAALRGRPAEEQTQLVLTALADAGLVPPELGPQIRSRLRVFLGIARAVRTYRPQPTGGPITVLSPADRLAERLRQWAALGLGPVGHVAVPGTHYTMLRPPHVEAVAAEVAGRLAAADPVRS